MRVYGVFDGAAVNTAVSNSSYSVSPSHLQLREMPNDVDNVQNIKETHAFFKRTTLFRLRHFLSVIQSWFQVSFSNQTLFPSELQAINTKVLQA